MVLAWSSFLPSSNVQADRNNSGRQKVKREAAKRRQLKGEECRSAGSIMSTYHGIELKLDHVANLCTDGARVEGQFAILANLDLVARGSSEC